LKDLADDTRLQRADVGGDVGQLRHEGFIFDIG
jgi:hypothetical protein